eukprot:7564289-Pyramimonas_sp.AAC.2
MPCSRKCRATRGSRRPQETPGGGRRPQEASGGSRRLPGRPQEAPRRGLGCQRVRRGSILGGCLKRNRNSLRIGIKIIGGGVWGARGYVGARSWGMSQAKPLFSENRC